MIILATDSAQVEHAVFPDGRRSRTNFQVFLRRLHLGALPDLSTSGQIFRDRQETVVVFGIYCYAVCKKTELLFRISAFPHFVYHLSSHFESFDTGGYTCINLRETMRNQEIIESCLNSPWCA